MVSKNNHYLNQKKSGRKFEKYSIKKLKVGAASVLVKWPQKVRLFLRRLKSSLFNS